MGWVLTGLHGSGFTVRIQKKWVAQQPGRLPPRKYEAGKQEALLVLGLEGSVLAVNPMLTQQG
jgi:hypothetical protein